MNEDLIGVQTFCQVCRGPIPEEMAKRKASTCCKEHEQLLKRIRRKRKDDKACRFCHRPATITQRQSWNRFRDWEVDHPELAHPQTVAVLTAAGMDADTIRKVGKEAYLQDFSLEYAAAPLLWPRKPVRPTAAHENLDRAMEILRQHWSEELARMTSQESHTVEEA